MRKTLLVTASPFVLAGLLAAGPVLAADQSLHTSPSASTKAERTTDKKMEAQNLVNKATDVANEMKKDPNLVEMMQKATGIFIVPKYAKGGLIIGAQGGEGVMLAHQDGAWADPVFYDIGGLSFGAQAGAAAGSITMLLMSDKAVDEFRQKNKFALNAEAGVSIVKYSAAGQATPGDADVVFWSDTDGAYVGADLSLTDIRRDDSQNQVYYGEPVTEAKVLGNDLANPGTKKLRNALPEG